jgi:putative ABC transport system ATP-binding protein
MSIAATKTGEAIRCVDVQHCYRLDGEIVTALHPLNLSVTAGRSAALVGPSGSGKSTLMTLLAGLQRPTAGHILVGDIDIATLSEPELLRVRAERLGTVVQNPSRNLLPYADAEANIRFAQRGARSYGRHDLVEPAVLLSRLGLSALAGVRADRLSGGERQRLSLAVGMAAGPSVLLADEPTSQLDGANRDRVVDLLHRVNTEFGATVLVVTHDHAVADSFDETIAIDAGRVRQEMRW